MSNPTTPFGWQMPTPTDLVTDLPADFEVFGQAVATSMQDLLGGTTGQILTKASNTDMDFAWSAASPGDITGVTAGTGISGGGTSGDVTITNSMATAIDAKGDLIVGTGADTFSKLSAGTNGYLLTADSAEATGLKWAAPAGGGGKVLQVIQDLQTGLVQTTSTSFQSTGLSVSITPSSTTSKILVLGSISIAKTAGNSQTSVKLQIVRGATTIMDMGAQSGYTNASETNDVGYSAICFLDSPSTTSATTYAIQFASSVSGQTAYVNNYGPTDTAVSSIVVMEIGA